MTIRGGISLTTVDDHSFRMKLLSLFNGDLSKLISTELVANCIDHSVKQRVLLVDSEARDTAVARPTLGFYMPGAEFNPLNRRLFTSKSNSKMVYETLCQLFNLTGGKGDAKRQRGSQYGQGENNMALGLAADVEGEIICYDAHTRSGAMLLYRLFPDDVVQGTNRSRRTCIPAHFDAF